ncbi:hypothetical protein HKD37_14G039443 [Glycine soja]
MDRVRGDRVVADLTSISQHLTIPEPVFENQGVATPNNLAAVAATAPVAVKLVPTLLLQILWCSRTSSRRRASGRLSRRPLKPNSECCRSENCLQLPVLTGFSFSNLRGVGGKLQIDSRKEEWRRRLEER